MITIPQVVEQYVRQSPYLEEALTMDILNISSLARLLKPQIQQKLQKKIQTGAIIMALKRLSTQIKQKHSPAHVLLSKISDITVRSNLIEYTYANSETLAQKHSQLLKKIVEKKDIFITITHGVFETTMFGTASIEPYIKKLFAEEELVSVLHNLSSITIRLPIETVKIPGVHYFILRQLAWENINIVESISTYTEFTIVLDNKEVDRAFSVLNNSLGKNSLT